MIFISRAILLLHEIYGINDFMMKQSEYFEKAGFTVYCPNLLKRPAFSYQEAEQAYDYYYSQDYSKMTSYIFEYIEQLSKLHEQLFVLGYSVGGTLAWLCSEKAECSGVIACYGSRIRDQLQIVPKCKTLLLFSQEATFSIEELAVELRKKQNTSVHLFDAGHGFLDPFSISHNQILAEKAQEEILEFLNSVV